MKHSFLLMLGKIEGFLSERACRVCGARSCKQQDACDPHAAIDPAIKRFATDTRPILESPLADSSQTYLSYMAGRYLVSARSRLANYLENSRPSKVRK